MLMSTVLLWQDCFSKHPEIRHSAIAMCSNVPAIALSGFVGFHYVSTVEVSFLARFLVALHEPQATSDICSGRTYSTANPDVPALAKDGALQIFLQLHPNVMTLPLRSQCQVFIAP